MSTSVKPHRRYDSPKRQEQAEQNRWAVLQAARHLFLERGFAATTMPAIASGAGVSVQTVYKVFGNKPRLAKAVFDVAMAGDDEPTPCSSAPRSAEFDAEPTRAKLLQLYGEFLAEVAPRHVPVQLVIRDAAGSDPEAGAVWAELQRNVSRHDAVRQGPARRRQPAPRGFDQRSPRRALDLQLRRALPTARP